MSVVKIHTPKPRLAQLLRQPGGTAVADAVQQAGAGLATLRTDCLSELKATLEQAEACAARATGAYDEAVATELYGIIAAQIGVPSVCGLASVDTALTSLADLLDYLKNKQAWDVNAVAVHLRAFRLLLAAEGRLDAAGAEAILQGLRKVSERYAKP